MGFLGVEAIAPATSANLGAGFDVFGVALDVLFDSVYVEQIEDNHVEITAEGIGARRLPTDPARNTAGIVAVELLKAAKKKCGLKLRIKKGIKPGSGLGSSAASAAASAVAINELLQLGLSKNEIIGFAAQGEVASAGAPHADNVSAAVLGGFTVIRSRKPLDVISLSMPENVEFAVVLPEISLSTSVARSVLPKQVSIPKLVHNVGHAAAFVAGIALKDVDLMGKAMSDSVVEPARTPLIQGLEHVKERALEAGAGGVTISGAGPSVIALVNSDRADAGKVGEAMQMAFEEHRVRSQVFRSKPGQGAQIVRRV